MCGLVTVLSKKGIPAGQYAFDLYKKQATRGRQGYGYLAIQDNKLVGVHRSKDEAGIRALLMKEKAEMILLHHRLPTSTSNTIGTTHPMFVSHDELKYDYYFAHNGVISNAEFLKKGHNEKGYIYRTEHKEYEIAEYVDGSVEQMSAVVTKFNDSETLAIELARHIEGLSSTINTRGAAAFWGISLEKGTNNVVNMFFGKNKGRALSCIANKKWFCITSETGYDIQDMELNTVDMKTMLIEQEPLMIDEAVPVVTTPHYNYNGHLPNRNHIPSTPSTPPVGFKDKNSDILAYETLEDKLYTTAERDETGLPPSEFTGVWTGGVLRYKPTKFIAPQHRLPSGRDEGKDLASKLFDDEDATDEASEAQAKAMRTLEELAYKYAKNSTALDSLEEAFAKHRVNTLLYHNQKKEIETEMEDLETDMSSLGIDQGVVEGIVQTAIDLEDYNNTEIQYDDDTRYINS